MVIRDRRVAVSYTIEALRIFDHYHFRIAQREAKKAKKKLQLAKPPRKPERSRGSTKTTRTRARSATASYLRGRCGAPARGTSHIRDGSQVARIGNAIRIIRRSRSVMMNGITP